MGRDEREGGGQRRLLQDRENWPGLISDRPCPSLLGAFIIPKVFGEEIKAATPEYALYGFAAFYVICLVLNWWYYLGPKREFNNP